MRLDTLKLILILLTSLTLSFGLVACGDDDDDNNGSDTMTGDTAGGDTTGEDTTGTDTMVEDTNGTDTTAEDTNVEDTNVEDTNVEDTTPYVPTEWAVVVIGELADLGTAQTDHDALAAGGEADAKAAGDIAHDVLLGTTLLGSTENEFFAQDRWTDVTGMTTFYSDPDFGAAFAALFAAEPSITMWAKRGDWYTWGDMMSGDASDPYFFVVVRGRLASDDLAAMQGIHDTIAAGGEAGATAAGDVAHTVWLGLVDSQEFLAIDIWSDSTNLEAFYSDPQFQEAFGVLLEAPPTIGVYQSSTWHQW